MAIGRCAGSAEFTLITNQAFVSRRESAQIDALLDQHLALVDATVALIHRGRPLGQFRPGAATEPATLEAALGDRFVAAHPSTLTGLLTREHT